MTMVDINVSESNVSLMDEMYHHELTAIVENHKRSFLQLEQPATLAILVLYVPVFMLALTANLLVIVSVVKSADVRSKPRHYYLVSLTVADLLVTTVCMPTALATQLYLPWLFGPLLCKITAFLQGVAVSSSLFSLTVLAVERYMAVSHPQLFAKFGRPQTAVGVVLSIWLLAAALMWPLAAVKELRHEQILTLEYHMCAESWPTVESILAFSVLNLVLVFMAPSSVIIYCYFVICRKLYSSVKLERRRKDEQSQSGPDCEPYSKSKSGSTSGDHQLRLDVTPTSRSTSRVAISHRRIARLILVLIATFLVSWLPYSLLSVTIDVINTMRVSDQLRSTARTLTVNILPFTILLGHSHSAVNPLVYWVFNSTFRRAMRRVLRCFILKPKWRPLWSVSRTGRHQYTKPTAAMDITQLDTRRRQQQEQQQQQQQHLSQELLGGQRAMKETKGQNWLEDVV